MHTRYHGILGPCASARHRIVPAAVPATRAIDRAPCAEHAEHVPTEPGTQATDGPPAGDLPADLAAPEPPVSSTPSDPRALGPPRAPPSRAEDRARPRRLAWADLVRRIFAQDVLRCPDCGGRMRILAAIHPPEATEAILACLGLPVRAPPIRPARPEEEAPGQWDERADGARYEDDFGA